MQFKKNIYEDNEQKLQSIIVQYLIFGASTLSQSIKKKANDIID